MRFNRRSKYRAIPTIIDGIRFASKAEAKRYWELKLLEKAGNIANLTLQPEFKFPCGVKYCGDFRYEEQRKDCMRVVVEDVKGFETAAFRIKAKMFKHHYPAVDFRVVK